MLVFIWDQSFTSLKCRVICNIYTLAMLLTLPRRYRTNFELYWGNASHTLHITRRLQTHLAESFRNLGLFANRLASTRAVYWCYKKQNNKYLRNVLINKSQWKPRAISKISNNQRKSILIDFNWKLFNSFNSKHWLTFQYHFSIQNEDFVLQTVDLRYHDAIARHASSIFGFNNNLFPLIYQ